jgi:tRNA (guanine37-N1)-methyltransferase
MRFDIVTIFPDMFRGVFEYGIVRRAVEAGLAEVYVHNLRDYAQDKHRQVDDRPFGGGAGMVMKPEPIFRAVRDIREKARAQDSFTALLSPQGRLFDQQMAANMATKSHVILICGRYEGVDERVAEHLADDEISIGDYVLSGGEIPAMVIVDAVVRLLPGAVGRDESIRRESFVGGLLDYPHYTRPADYCGMKVPEVLLSGNHAKIESWRRRKQLEKTLRRRPDLIARAPLSEQERRELEKMEGQGEQS